MRKILKWVLSSTLLLAAVGLCVHRFAEVEWSRVDYDKVLAPITFNANALEESATVALTGEARVRRQVRNAAVEVVTPMGRGSGTLFLLLEEMVRWYSVPPFFQPTMLTWL